MSLIRQQTTEMSEQDCLVEALKKTGYSPAVQERAPIRGHYDEMSTEGCEIVLKKEDTGRKADIGFSKQKDGTFTVVTDTYVNRDLSDLSKFATGIKVEYVKAHGRKIARKNGMIFKGERKLTNGKTRMVFAQA
jgi:hypothetical protein